MDCLDLGGGGREGKGAAEVTSQLIRLAAAGADGEVGQFVGQGGEQLLHRW